MQSTAPELRFADSAYPQLSDNTAWRCLVQLVRLCTW